MSRLFILPILVIVFSCAQKKTNEGWDDIQREEEVQKEEENRTSISDEIGPAFERNGRLNSPTPVE